MRFTISSGLIIAFLLAFPVNAQELVKQRLTREPSRSADGRIIGKATVGRLVIDTTVTVFKDYNKFENRKIADLLLSGTLCIKDSGSTQLILSVARGQLKRFSKIDRKLVNSGDVSAQKKLVLATVAYLDGTLPQAIIDDEAIGPGAYNEPLSAMEFAFNKCSYFSAL